MLLSVQANLSLARYGLGGGILWELPVRHTQALGLPQEVSLLHRSPSTFPRVRCTIGTPITVILTVSETQVDHPSQVHITVIVMVGG
jgi:hypothetical protein